MNLTDLTSKNVNQSNNIPKAEFNFTDPTGKIKYRVVLKKIENVAESIFINSCIYGNFSNYKCTGPTAYSYGVVWVLENFM